MHGIPQAVLLLIYAGLMTICVELVKRLLNRRDIKIDKLSVTKVEFGSQILGEATGIRQDLQKRLSEMEMKYEHMMELVQQGNEKMNTFRDEAYRAREELAEAATRKEKLLQTQIQRLQTENEILRNAFHEMHPGVDLIGLPKGSTFYPDAAHIESIMGTSEGADVPMLMPGDMHHD